ncbi:MAG TPA: PRC-barrel domain-containing protein [Solirubrobacterales bacterium]|nr:PRC-barrel domain-containing protein [Solirubrobacterales bacterium]
MDEASVEPLPSPPLEEARRWVGHDLDDLDGGGVGSVQGFFVDAEAGRPTWLIAKLGRFGGRLVAVPIAGCAAAGGRVWVAQERARIRSAPVVDPTRPLLREHELTICSHFGIGEKVGRAAEVLGRPEGATTSKPA